MSVETSESVEVSGSAEAEASLAAKVRLYRTLTFVFAAVGVFLAIVLVGQLTMTTPGSAAPAPRSTDVAATDAAAPAPSAADSIVVERDPDDPAALGAVDAPLVLVQWTDLRCPFCAAFHRNSLPTIVEEYVDAGLVRVEMRDVAFFGEESEDASVAVRAAAEQGMYFAYLDAVFAAAPEGQRADLPREKLIAFAETAGVPDLDRFVAALDDPALRAEAQAGTVAAQQLGVTSVPFFVAGNQAIAGAQPVEIFRDFLDGALAAAE